MTPKDLLLALLVIVVWGLNFVVIKVGLHGMPPMLMGALRFMLAAFPAILFVRRPQVPLRWMLAYGMTISLGQFAFLFYAMYVGMPAGLASLVLQSQAFFTLFFAALFPQFVPAGSGKDVLVLMVLTFVMVKFLVLGGYALGARQVGRLLRKPGHARLGRMLTGIVFLVFGTTMIWSAFADKA